MKRCVTFDEHEKMINKIEELAKEISSLVMSTCGFIQLGDFHATWALNGLITSFCKVSLGIEEEELEQQLQRNKIGDMVEALVNVRYRDEINKHEMELYGYVTGVVEMGLIMLLEDCVEVIDD